MRFRLVAVSLAVTSMVALAFLIPLMILTRSLARDRALNAAEQQAETAAQLLSAAATAGGDIDPAAVFDALGFADLSLVLPDGSSIGAPVPADEDLQDVRRGGAGSQDVPGGAAVYVPVATSSGEILIIRAFVPEQDLSLNVDRSWVILGGLALILVGIAVVVADALGRTIVRPVEDLSDAALLLSEGELDTRVQPSGPPELARVGEEFNHLASRVSELIQQERELAADLSHRLRTPLTAARLDAESLPPGDLRDRLLDDLAELERSIDFIITAARSAAPADGTRSDVGAVVTERALFWDALAEEQERPTELSINVDRPLWSPIDPRNLAAAVDALVGNVFAHTDEGVGYAVIVEQTDAQAVVHVDDAGPGVPSPEAVARGHSGGGSTGLGLDIARRTAEAAGGSFSVDTSPLGGARFTMRFATIGD